MNIDVITKAKALKKLFDAGFIDKDKILRLKVEELDNISDLTINDIRIISKFRKAIKENNLIAFLVGEEGKNGNK